MKTFNQFCHDETAATATEYALLLAAIAGLLLVSLIFMGNESGTFWVVPPILLKRFRVNGFASNQSKTFRRFIKHRVHVGDETT